MARRFHETVLSGKLRQAVRRETNGRDTHVGVLLTEDICNRSTGFCAFVPRQETPSPHLVGCPTDGLAELSREHSLVKSPRHGIVLLLATEGSPALAGSPFRLGIPHQTCMQTPLSEVHELCYLGPNIFAPADAQRFCETNVGKDEGYLGVTTPTQNFPPFRRQDLREAAPHLS